MALFVRARASCVCVCIVACIYISLRMHIYLRTKHASIIHVHIIMYVQRGCLDICHDVGRVSKYGAKDFISYARAHASTHIYVSPLRAIFEVMSNILSVRGGGLGSSTIFKKFNGPYAPS